VSESYLGLMILQESKVAELYQAFADLDPARGEYWSSMAEAERRHADMLRELQSFLPSRQALLLEGRVRAEAIKAFLSYADGVLEKARKEGIPPVKALSIAADIEKSLLEKGMLDRFRGASPEVNRVLARLREETAEHAAMAEEMWRKHRLSS